MKILVLQETKSRKPDLMSCAVTEAFSLSDDIVTIATIKVGGILKTVTTIKELVKQYQPDVVVAQKMLASIVLFELPKSIRKIIIDPYLLFDDNAEETVLTMIMKYGSVRLNNWLRLCSAKLIGHPESIGIANSFCIVRNRMSTISRYDKLISVYTNENILHVADASDAIEKISTYHRALNKARIYFDSDFELPSEDELLNHK